MVLKRIVWNGNKTKNSRISILLNNSIALVPFKSHLNSLILQKLIHSLRLLDIDGSKTEAAGNIRMSFTKTSKPWVGRLDVTIHGGQA